MNGLSATNVSPAATTAAAAPAAAADLPAKVYTKALPVAPIYNWGGFYIGLDAGGGSRGPEPALRQREDHVLRPVFLHLGL